MLKVSICHNSILFSTSFSEQLWLTIFLSRIRLWALPIKLLHYYNGAFSFKIRNFGLKDERWEFLTEVFFTVNYTSSTWVCLIKTLRHTFVCLLSGWPYRNIPPSGKYMKFIHLYQSSCKITPFLVLKISFNQKKFHFYIIFKVFSFILYVFMI